MAAKKSVPRDELGKYPCLLLRDSSRGRAQLEKFLVHREIALTITGEIESVDIIKNFVKHTSAMTLLPGWSIAAELKDQSLTALPLGRTPFERTWGFMHSRSRPLNHTESILLKLCRKQVAELV